MSNRRLTTFFVLLKYLELSQRRSDRQGFSDWPQQEMRHRQGIQGSFTVKVLTILVRRVICFSSWCWTDLPEKQSIVVNVGSDPHDVLKECSKLMRLL